MTIDTTIDSAPRVLLASGVNITNLPLSGPDMRPEKDFEVLQRAFESSIVDSENYLEVGGPTARLTDKALGSKWGVAAAALYSARARGVQAIIATGDDIGVPLGVLLRITNTRIPLLTIAQHMMSRRPKFFLGKIRMHQSFTKFLCLAEAQARFLHEQYHISYDRLSTIYYFVDHRFYKPLPDIPVLHQICSAGMTHRDYKTLIEATRSLDVHVKVEAHSAWLTDGPNFTQDMLHDRFEICSYGTSHALRQIYAESKIVVVPVENVPYVVGYSTLLEGMAMGKPVIATQIKLSGDFIRDGWNGLLVRPEDPQHLRERIQFLLDHPEEARRLGENARRTIEERFTLDHYRDRIEGLVHQVVNGTSAVLDQHHIAGA